MFSHLPGQRSVPQRVLHWMAAASLGMGLICCPPVMAQAVDAQLPPQIKALVAKAQAERDVVIYTAQSDDINGELKSGFEKAFGIKMSYARLVAGPQIEKIRQELGADSVRVDVFDIGDRNFVREMADNKLLQPISELRLTVGAPADASVASYCVQAQQFSHAIAFNTRLVPATAAPNTWTDLLAPAFKGQIGVLSPRVGGGILAWWYVMTTELGEDFFTKLAPQNVRMYEDVGSIDNDLSSGAIAVQIPAWPYAIQGLVDAGAPIKAVYPSPTSGVASSDCLMKAAPHPNAGKLFIWYVMTKEGQTALNGHHRGYSVIPGVADSAPAPAKTVFPPSADIAAARDKLFALADKTARPGK
jgi:iron(III) transport system substrate-binding protein